MIIPLILFFSIFSIPTQAQEATYDISASAIGSYEHAKLNQNMAPKNNTQLESRINTNFNYSLFQFIARPRLTGFYQDTKSSYLINFQEEYITFHLLSDLFYSYGRINYGWGLSESISPTNLMNPEILWQIEPFFEQRGVHQGKLNFSYGQNFSFVFMHELVDLKDRISDIPYQRGAFRARMLSKFEYNWDNASKIFGLMLGRENKFDTTVYRLGSYGSISLNDAWQLYFDFCEKQKTAHEKNWDNLSVLGGRYTVNNGPELRLEYIYNQAGLTKSQEEADPVQSLMLQLNQQLLTKNYLYSSLRWMNPNFSPDFFEQPILAIRSLHSLADDSTSLLLSAESSFHNIWTGYLYGGFGLGQKNHEMRLVYDNILGVALKWSY